MQQRQHFLDTLNDAVLSFPDNPTTRRIVDGTFDLPGYHALLVSMYHISHEGPATSALAASCCPAGFEPARAVLLHHAAHSSDHWQWILNDLKATGFSGPDPAGCFPGTATQAWIAYNYYVAQKAPLARLGIIALLESLLRSFSANYSSRVFQHLSIRPSQASFFFRPEGPAQADGGLRDTVLKTLDRLPMSDRDWQWLINATATASILYRATY